MPSTRLNTSKPLGLHSILADSPLRTSHWYPLPHGPLVASHPAQIVSKFVRCFKPGVGPLSLLTSLGLPGLFVETVHLQLLGVTSCGPLLVRSLALDSVTLPVIRCFRCFCGVGSCFRSCFGCED